MKMTFRNKYTYEVRFGNPLHMWTSVTHLGGLHLHITDLGQDNGSGRYFGGLEIHRRSPPDCQVGEPPSHDNCFLLHQPCWHDGSSLAATEMWIPRWLVDPHNHDRMFSILNDELEARLTEEEESNA